MTDLPVDQASESVVASAVVPDFVNTDRPRIRCTLWDLFAGIIPLCAMLPLVIPQWVATWARPHMQFFPVTLFAVVAFLLLRLFWQPTKNRIRSWVAIGLVALGTITFLMAGWYFSPALAYLSFCVAFCGWLLGRWGSQDWTAAVAMSLLLVTTMVWPKNLDFQFIYFLEQWGASFASSTLDVFKIPNLLHMGQFKTEQFEATIGEINGLASIYMLFSASALLGILFHRSFVHSLLLSISQCLSYVTCIWLLLVLNETSIVEYQYDLLLAENIFTTRVFVCGLLLCNTLIVDAFLFAMLRPTPVSDPQFGGVYVALNNLFCWPQYHESEWTAEDEIPPAEEELMDMVEQSKPDASPPPPDFHWFAHPASRYTLMFSALLGLGMGIPTGRVMFDATLQPAAAHTLRPEVIAKLPTEATFPSRFGNWKQVSFDPGFGEDLENLEDIQVSWQYDWLGHRIEVRLTYPHSRWIKVLSSDQQRYQLLQGEILKKTADRWIIRLEEYVNSLGGRVYLADCAMTDAGEMLNDLKEDSAAEDRSAPLLEKLKQDKESSRPVTMVIQASCETGAPMEQKELQEFLVTFGLFRTALRESILVDVPQKAP